MNQTFLVEVILKFVEILDEFFDANSDELFYF